MPPVFELTVAKETLGFSAAHFLTLRDHVCERLHGHNYRIGATVTGPVDPHTGFVIDFALLKQALRTIADRMDHRVLIPVANRELTVREAGDRVVVDYHWPEWLVVPTPHACLLPVSQTTAERLAEFAAAEVWTTLTTAGATMTALAVEIEESHGQGATCRLDANPN